MLRGVGALFGSLLGDPLTMTFNMVLTVLVCFGVCLLGLQAGVEKNHKNNDVMPAHPHVSLSCKLHVLTRSGSWS